VALSNRTFPAAYQARFPARRASQPPKSDQPRGEKAITCQVDLLYRMIDIIDRDIIGWPNVPLPRDG